MPNIDSIADYMVALARLNLDSPSNVLTTMHQESAQTIRRQAHEVLARHGTPKEKRVSAAWLALHTTEIS